MINICQVHGETDSVNWKYTSQGWFCQECHKPTTLRGDFLTQASTRVMLDRINNQKELTQPYIGDKPNPEFIKAYPEYAPSYYSNKDLKALGATGLKSQKHKPFKKYGRK